MKTKQEIDVEYFENHDFGDELYEAEKRGDLIFCKVGESAIEAAKRHRAEKAARLAATPAFTVKTASRRRHVAAVAAL